MSRLVSSPYWAHKPIAKQMAFLAYDGLEAFYGGAASGGKSDALLMGALQYVDHPSYAAIIFRRSYADLSRPGALMDRAMQWLKPHKEVKWDREKHTFVFPSGAKLTFGYIQTANDKWNYQSSEVQYIGWDEIAEFPDDDGYTFMFSRLRKLEGVQIPLRVRCASNPIGRGAWWVKNRFLDNDPPPLDHEGNIDLSQRIFIPATFKDNHHVDARAYAQSLQNLPEGTRQRLMEGSWDVTEDVAYSDFDESIHVIDPIAVPAQWYRWDAMDFGIANPTAWLAAAMSYDEEIVIYGEYYSPGLISDHASRILTFRANSWGAPSITLADPSITQRTGISREGFGSSGRGATVHSEFAANGISLVPANNDRRAGRVRISELLRPDPSKPFPEWHPRAGELGSPRLFITSNCKNLIGQIKFAPVDEAEGEITDPYWESRHGHAVAACRYLLTARNVPNQKKEVARNGRYYSDFKEWRDWSSV